MGIVWVTLRSQLKKKNEHFNLKLGKVKSGHFWQRGLRVERETLLSFYYAILLYYTIWLSIRWPLSDNWKSNNQIKKMQILQKDKILVSIKHFINVPLQLPPRWVHIKRFIYTKYTHRFAHIWWVEES